MTELDPEIAAMLRREGARVDVPEEAAARVAARLSSSIGGGAGGGGGGGSAGNGSAGAGTLATKLAPFLVTFAVGAGVGGAVVAAVKTEAVVPAAHVASAPSASAAPVAREVPSAAPSSSMATVSVDALPSALVLPPPTTTASAARATPLADAGVSDAPEDTFVAERRVLDTARTALARGDHAAAVHALDEHARTYTKGRLEEEREALLVRTLADSGKLEEARARAVRFRSRWPTSVLLPAIEAATGGP